MLLLGLVFLFEPTFRGLVEKALPRSAVAPVDWSDEFAVAFDLCSLHFLSVC